MATIVTRAGKGSPLTHNEVDANFNNLNNDKVEESTTITAGTGLTGGGDLSANRTISLANTAVAAGSYGSASAVGTFTVDAQGRLTAASNTNIAIANTAVSGLGTMSTQNANSVAITGGSINGTTVGASTATTGAFTTLSASSGATISGGNLTFSSTAQRITGDMANSTHTNRLLFQNSGANLPTIVGALPNGTSVTTGFLAYGGSTAADTSTASLVLNGGTDTRISSSILGTASYLPMTFYTGGSERVRIDTSGNTGFGGTAQGNIRVHALGDFPILGGNATSTAFGATGTIPTSITSTARGFYTSLTTAASFTLSNAIHFQASNVNVGAGSTVTNQFGFLAGSGLNTATNNYGFYGDIASGSNRYNVYMAGTADNYFAGNVGINVAPPTIPLQIGKGGGGNPATSGTTQTYGIARIGSSGAAALDVGTYAAGQVWMQGVNVTNLATNYDLVLQPNGGNVGIGTASPSNKLQVAGSLYQTGDYVNIGGYNSGGQNTPAQNAVAFGTNITNGQAEVDIWNTLDPASYANTGILFTQRLSSTTRRDLMFLHNNGNVGIGTTAPTDFGGRNLNITAPSSSAYASQLWVSGSYIMEVLVNQASAVMSVGSRSNHKLDLCTNDTTRMTITNGGEVYIAGTTDQGAYNLQCNGTGVWGAGAYVNGSDARLKDDITTLNDGLNVISQLRPVTFKYKPDYSKDQNVQTGFIAQELQAVLVGKDYVDGIVQAGPNHLNVAYQSLIPILVKAIQELTARVAELEAK